MRSSLCFVLVAIYLVGCDRNADGDREIKGKAFNQTVIKRVEGKAGFPFPVGTTGMRMLERDLLHPGFVAMLGIPTNGNESVAEELRKKTAAPFTVAQNGLTKGLPWWQPDEKKTISQRIYMNGGDLIVARLCSHSNSLVLYIECTLME
jgi:hypothetical protein